MDRDGATFFLNVAQFGPPGDILLNQLCEQHQRLVIDLLRDYSTL